MAKTATEMLADFAPAIATLSKRLDTAEKSIDSIAGSQQSSGDLVRETKEAVAVLREQLVQIKAELGPNLKVDIGILKRDVDELRTTKEQWTQRLWNLAGPLLGAVVGGVLGYFLRKPGP